MKRKVLIIDDEKDTCLLLKRYLSSKNFEVYCSYSLADGLQQLDSKQPDILFLDNNLPDGFGWDASGSLVQKYPNLEIHLISAYNNRMYDYNHLNKEVKVWQKPISIRQLEQELCLQRAS